MIKRHRISQSLRQTFQSITSPEHGIEQQRWWNILRLFTLFIIGGLGILAYWAFENESHTNGFASLGLAAFLLVITTPGLPLRTFRAEQSPQWRETKMLRLFGMTFIVTGVAMLLWAAENFLRLGNEEIPTPSNWDTYVLGLAMLAGGGWMVSRPHQERNRWPWWSYVLLAGVMALAIFMRVYQFEEFPAGIWFDEAINGLEARRMLDDPQYRPVFISNMTAPHLWLYKTMLDLYGNNNIWALRAVSTAFGVGSVLVAFLVGRQLRGPWFGLLMAFFLAVARWSINFSRVAMTGIEVTFFVLLAFYFAVRLVRYRQVRDALWLGLAVGFGLWFYAAFRFMLIPIGIFGLTVWRWWRPQNSILILVTGLVALAVIFPLLIFAYQQEDEFFHRARQTTIFDEQNRQLYPELDDALKHSIERHVEMFHVEGDGNGRHNLPGEPMLDPVMGVLMVLGLGLALCRLRNPHEAFFVAVLLIGLLPGVLTLAFEAPQGLRTIGILPAIAYFCALAMFGIARLILGSSEHLPNRQRVVYPALGGMMLLLMVGITAINFDIYHRQQSKSYEVWQAYSSVETALGHELNNIPPNEQIYVSPLISGAVSTVFVAEEWEGRQQALELPDGLPLRIPPPGRPVWIFLHEDDRWMWDYARYLYFNAEFRAVWAEDYGISPEHSTPLFYVIKLNEADITSIQGLDEDGQGVLYVAWEGLYTFEFAEGVQVEVDGYALGTEVNQRYLTLGNHQFSVSPPDAEVGWQHHRARRSELIPEWMLYHDPAVPHGLLGCYYPNADWKGTPSFQRLDPALDLYFHHIPLPRPYSVSWAGWLMVPQPGAYGFYLSAEPQAEVWLGEQQILSVNLQHPTDDYRMTMESGLYPIKIRFQDNAKYSAIRLRWNPPFYDEFKTIAPQYFMSPLLGPGGEDIDPLTYCKN